MNMKQGEPALSDRDYDMLLTNSPRRFINSIVGSIFWDVRADRQVDFKRYQTIFDRWLSIYMIDVTEPVDEWIDKQVVNAENFGRLQALSTLPIKKVGMFKKREVVDLAAVTETIKRLTK